MNKIAIVIYKFYSLFFCLRYLSLRQAIRIPVLIHPSVKIGKMYRGAIGFNGVIKSSMLVFGFPGTAGQSNCRSLISIERGGKLVISENVQMARGTRITINRCGVMQIGRHFWCNGDCFFNCTTNITLGDNNMYGWNINFNTTDGHHVYDDGVMKPMEGEIVIGNHVWIASYSNIAKNVQIADDCVVAQGSLVNKNFEQTHCLIGGMPAKVIKENIIWTAD